MKRERQSPVDLEMGGVSSSPSVEDEEGLASSTSELQLNQSYFITKQMNYLSSTSTNRTNDELKRTRVENAHSNVDVDEADLGRIACSRPTQIFRPIPTKTTAMTSVPAFVPPGFPLAPCPSATLHHHSSVFSNNARQTSTHLNNNPPKLGPSVMQEKKESQNLDPMTFLRRLCDLMDMDSYTRTTCTNLLKSFLEALGAARAAEESFKKYSLWAASALWITRKLYATSNGRHGMAMFEVINNMFNLLGQSRPKNYFVSDDFPNFLSVVNAFTQECPVSHLSTEHKVTISAILTSTAHFYTSLKSAFNVFDELFPILYDKDPPAPPKPTARNTPSQYRDSRCMDDYDDPVESKTLSQYGELHYYSWLLFLYARESIPECLASTEQQNQLLRLLLFFTTSQPEKGRTTVAYVCAKLCPNVSLNPSMDFNVDWINWYSSIVAEIPDLAPIAKVVESKLCDLIRELERTNKIQRNEERVQGDLPWMLYVHSLDLPHLLQVNQESISKAYEGRLKERGYELDGRFFRPTSRAIATPRRFSRTPRASTAGASSVNRNLTIQFEKNRILNKPMPATPLTAYMTKTCPVDSTPSVHSSDSPKKLELLTHQWNLPNSASVYIISLPRMDRSIGEKMEIRKSQLFQQFDCEWRGQEVITRLASKLYIKFVDSIVKIQGVKLTHQYLDRLLRDSKFHRALLLVAIDMARCSYKVTTIRFEQVMKMFDVRPFELSMIVELIAVNDTWIPWALQKRLKEMEERLLEASIWNDVEFIKMMTDMEAAHVNTIVSSETCRLYAYHSGQGQIDRGSSRALALDYLIDKIQRMALLRMETLCKQMKLRAEVAQLAKKAFLILLKAERKNKLLVNRHLDVIWLCCLRGAEKWNEVPGSPSWNAFLSEYRSQPQALEHTYMEVLSPDNRTSVPIDNFYNKFFMPKFFKPVIQLLEEGGGAGSAPENALPNFPSVTGTGPMRMGVELPSMSRLPSETPLRMIALQNAMLRPINGMTSVCSSPSRSVAMTPITQKLTNFTDSPVKSPGAFSNGTTAKKPIFSDRLGVHCPIARGMDLQSFNRSSAGGARSPRGGCRAMGAMHSRSALASGISFPLPRLPPPSTPHGSPMMPAVSSAFVPHQPHLFPPPSA